LNRSDKFDPFAIKAVSAPHACNREKERGGKTNIENGNQIPYTPSTYNHFLGNYSWGKITLGSRTNPQEFDAYTLNGFSGISTSALVTRVAPLKSQDYSA